MENVLISKQIKKHESKLKFQLSNKESEIGVKNVHGEFLSSIKFQKNLANVFFFRFHFIIELLSILLTPERK